MVDKVKKSKGKKSQGEDDKIYLSNIRCFDCHEHGHYALNCPQKKESKMEPAVATTNEVLASQFKLDFTLIACMTITVMGCMWYLDSSASFDMMGNKYIFSDLEEDFQ